MFVSFYKYWRRLRNDSWDLERRNYSISHLLRRLTYLGFVHTFVSIGHIESFCEMDIKFDLRIKSQFFYEIIYI